MDTLKITVQSVTKQFKNIPVLSGITYNFDQQGTYAITGHSGSGKSTLLHIIAGLEAPTQGTVLYNTVNIEHCSKKYREHIFTHKLGLLFQLPYLIDELTVIENVMCKGFIAGVPFQECYDEALGLLKALGIEEKAAVAPRSLSGGQQQRVALARALFLRPQFLLADEPTGNLDEETGSMIIDILLQYHKHHGMGIIISSHDTYVTHKMGTILRLQHGHLIEATKE
jgi:ABC-type lipoprotein export system ATPase subunit